MKFNTALRNATVLVISVTSVGALILAGCKAGKSDTKTSSHALPDLITASAIVDVNGDGKNDIIIGSHKASGESGYAAPLLLINNGDGLSFTKSTTAFPAQYLGVDGSAVDIKTGDFNNDGKVDVLTSTVELRPNLYKSSKIQLYLGKGDGTFTDASSNITNGAWTAWIGSVINSSAFEGWVEFIRVADIDGDGSLDFIVSSISPYAGTIYMNDGAGNFAPAPISVDGVSLPLGFVGHQTMSVRDVLTGDVNNDGKPDLLFPGGTSICINTSTPGVISFSTLGALPQEISQGNGNGIYQGALIDINGDGFLDLLTNELNGSTQVNAFTNNGIGVYKLDNSVLSPEQINVDNARQILVADLNGDTKQDVLFSNSGLDSAPFLGAPNLLLLNNGAGKLVDVTATNLDVVPAYTHQSAIGDLNGDGAPDLLLNNATFSGPEPRFWLNNGAGKFTSYTPTIL